MNQSLVSSSSITDFPLWDRMKEKQRVLEFRLELTARCNNNCGHCYINLPASDKVAQEKELSFEEIMDIADQAVQLGALWCTITGGEPLLREDFKDIYLGLKRKGLIVSVFTNATLIKEEHIQLFKKYPPSDIEVTVYGVTRETYEAVTHRPGSYQAFVQGLNLLLQNGLKVRLKAMALRSNFKELPQIAQFCRERTKDYFRFDPLLHLRLDLDPARNEEIKSERLTPQEIVAIEMADSERFTSLEKSCDKLINPELSHITSDRLFHCGTGSGSFVIGFDGNLRLCMSLQHPDCIYELREGSLADAWQNFVPKIRDMRSENEEFLDTCRTCPIINLCLWCPAHAYLETGEMDSWVEYFCLVAHERAKALGYEKEQSICSLTRKN
ncbi:MAG: radical SAM protein [Methanosarcina sp.]